MMKNRAVCSQEIELRNDKDRGWVFYQGRGFGVDERWGWMLTRGALR